MMQANKDIRKLALDKSVRLWEVADRLGIAEGSLSRKLRKELSYKEKQHIRQIIKGIADNRKE